MKHIFHLALAALITTFASTASAQSPFDRLLDSARKITDQTKKLQQATTDLNEQQEQEIGRDWASILLGAAPLVERPELQRYVNQLGRWIALQSDRPEIAWNFGVLNAPTLNAFATPGGYVFITRGLLERMRSEGELAGVLAHEIAHVVQRHHLNAMKSAGAMSLGTDALREFAQSRTRNSELTAKVVESAKEVMARGLDKNDEYEADRLGMRLAARAGYDPFGLPSVLQMLAAVSPSDSAVALMFATHPPPSARLDAIEQSLTPELEQARPRIVSSDEFRALVRAR